MKLKEFIKELKNKTNHRPLGKKYSAIWDKKVGILNNVNLNNEFSCAITALDLTNDVLNQAIKQGCNVIITHHPFLFLKDSKKEFYLDGYKKQILKLVNKHNILLYSAHTDYDLLDDGTSYQVATFLGFEDKIKPILNKKNYSVIVEAKFSALEMINLIKQKLNLNSLQTNIKNLTEQRINKILIFAGSGDQYEIINLWKKEKFDLLITSDIRWNEWVSYDEQGINVIQVPHLIEEVFAIDMQQKITKNITNSKVFFVKKQEIYRNI
ncbi:Nif3-like dinuclear metal center hexameric protein [Mycoplasma leonicaptivi]|uniref:Nif3-like dinuclear metal center hexameric protein n=1 Tax=Mycoplasma leonicaptivi TaxID=36742 RepID=UPI00048A439B|nr:Nif3-like dinuclear metal center hexameric protein [Mycoplasma leonicaptivi]